MRKVYVAISADFLHDGHLNVISKARELGDVIIGALTDKAIASYKRSPMLTLEQRIRIYENIKGVSQVVKQDELSYRKNLLDLRPDIVVHGDDWKSGPMSEIRNEVIETIKSYGGELVEVPYSHHLSSQGLMNQIRKMGTTPDLRLKSLRRLMEIKPIVRILEAHNGLTGLIVENTQVQVGTEIREYDGMWESSLTDSASKGKPDTSAVDVSSRLETIDQILDVTTKPMIVDGDNGGEPEHFAFTVRTLERLGVSAVIIEDKIGSKRNSLFGTEVDQTQDSIQDFSEKIATGKRAQISKEFMIIARIESLILKKGIDDAIQRAQGYLRAGADGIMIHSTEKKPDEILEFCRRYKELKLTAPLVVVPSSYATIYEKELIAAGVKIVIYANHLIRSAFPSMKKTAESILTNERCHEASQEICMPIKEIITLIPAEF